MLSLSKLIPIVGLVLCCPCLVSQPAVAQGCSIPASYTHRTSMTVGDLLVTLATDRENYVIGSPVHFWLSFENTGSVQLIIPNPAMITPMDGLLVLPASCDSLEETGCEDAYLYSYPSALYYFGVALRLNPGQCASYEHMWDGQPFPGYTVSPGLYTIFGGMVSYMGEFHTPEGGVRLPIQIQSSATVAVTPSTWGRVKAKY